MCTRRPHPVLILLLLLLLSPLLLLPPLPQNMANTLLLPECGCHRHFTPSSPSNTSTSSSTSTCSPSASLRGSGQKVVSFSYYGSPSQPHQQAKQYWEGLATNLASLPRALGQGWLVRLYHDLQQGEPLMEDLCRIACAR